MMARSEVIVARLELKELKLSLVCTLGMGVCWRWMVLESADSRVDCSGC